MSDTIAKAAKFAQAAHESIDQRRKYSGKPYIVHPAAVANTVARVTSDESTIAAAWLHDVVEDTPVTIGQITEEFGSLIAQLVDDLTDISCPSDGNRKTRAAIDRQHTAEADPRAKTVKLADVIDNVSDIVACDPNYAPKYVREKERLLQVLQEGNSSLYQEAVAAINRAKTEIQGIKRS